MFTRNGGREINTCQKETFLSVVLNLASLSSHLTSTRTMTIFTSLTFYKRILEKAYSQLP